MKISSTLISRLSFLLCFQHPLRKNSLYYFWVALFAFALQPKTFAGANTRMLHGHVPSVVKSLVSVSSLPVSNRMDLAIGLRMRDPNGLTTFLEQLYDPASPHYRNYLTPKQFTDRFGPTEADYQAVIRFAERNGLRVTATHPNRMVLDVSGSVADIERALHVTIRVYRHPTEARTFYAPDVEPSVDAALPILDISGLENYSRGRSNSKIKPAHPTGAEIPPTGSGPEGSYIGGDFRAAYASGVSLTGAGQTVGLLQLDAFYENDIVLYEGQAGLPNVPLTIIPVDGGVSTPGDGNLEVSLDIEMAIAMAPGISRVYVYEAPNNTAANIVDTISQMANDNLSKNLSTSWFTAPGFTSETGEQLLQQMAAQGQSFFCASGDGDAFTGPIPFPAESPFVVQVGGTFLTTNGPGGSWASEKVWNSRTPRQSGDYLGSSGGISTVFPIPSWQQGISMATNQGSTTNRNVPDVTMVGFGVHIVYNNGSNANGILGTSIAAPLWAGFTALINQQAAANGQPPVGFLNPALYAIGKGVNYTADFHDTTTGDNTWPESPSRFFAVTGYDLCAGLGSPQGASLISALLSGVPPPTPTPTPPPGPTALGNISTRLRVETGNNVLIGGFIVTGTQPKRVIVRALGPSLPFAGALVDPVLEIHDASGTLITANDDWKTRLDGSSQQAEIEATTIPPTNDLESAIVVTLPANNSGYTAVVGGYNNGTGIGVVEAYDLDRTVNSKLANISTRGFVSTGDNVMIAGTIIIGSNSARVIFRALGPSLLAIVPDALRDTTLELRDSNGTLIAFNDDWKTRPDGSSQQAEIEATTIPPTNDLESAIVATVPANNAAYTAIVRGYQNSEGVALVEAYQLQ